MEQKKSRRNLWIGLAVLAVVIAALVILYLNFGPKARTDEGDIHFQTEVVLTDGTSTTFDIYTDALYLGEALTEEKLIEGTPSDFGLFITTVNGVTADDSKQEWWCITKNGESVMTGVDATPIADGDHFEITLTAGY